MAKRKMTFTIPEETAKAFLLEIPSSRRSAFVAEALRKSLFERERSLAVASNALSAYGKVDGPEDEEDWLDGESDAKLEVPEGEVVATPVHLPELKDEELKSFEDVLRLVRGVV